MAKECKEGKDRCKLCKIRGEKKCTHKGGGFRLGMDDYTQDDDGENDGGDGGGMGEQYNHRESFTAHQVRAAQRSDMNDFERKAAEAHDRKKAAQQAEKEKKAKMRDEFKRKGVRFKGPDGTGYIKGGKKIYD